MDASSADPLLADLLARLDEMYRRAGRGDEDEAARSLRRADAAAHRFASLDLPEDRTELESRLERAIDRTESDARQLLDPGSTDGPREVPALGAMLARLDLLDRVARRVHDRPPTDAFPSLLAEIESLREHDGGPAPGSLDELRERTLDTRVRSLLERAARAPRPPRTASETVEAFHLSRALALPDAVRARGPDTELDEAAAQLDAERSRLFEEVLERIRAARSPADHEAAHAIAQELATELDEVRISALDSFHAGTTSELRRRIDEARRLVGALDRAARGASDAPEERRALRRSRRRVRRMARRTADVLSDRVLRSRVSRLFGRATVRVWESIVFWLILAALALIVVEHYASPSGKDALPWTVWLDTGICALLLADLGVRLALTPRRLRYFLRHFLTDFLPALPFGLLVLLEAHPAVRSVRVLRLARVFRVLRVLRPIVRFGRLALFLLRAADGLVERHARFLDRNIVFFNLREGTPAEPTLLARLRDLESFFRASAARRIRELPPARRDEAGAWRARLLLAAPRLLDATLAAPQKRSRPRATVDVDVDEVVQSLRSLDDARVAELLGAASAHQITESLRILRLPLLRRLPVVRYVVGPAGEPDPLGFTARLGRVLGDLLDAVKRGITWFTDLHGTITGSQFLDRLGMQLVRTFERPAKRLLLFTIAVAVVYAFVYLLRFEFLTDAADAVVRFLSLPVLVLGVVCAVPLLIGIWFRRIAGEAVDFFDRVAEAQFLSLTEIGKRAYAHREIGRLAERVVLPEARLRGPVDEERRRSLIDATRRRANTTVLPFEEDPPSDGGPDGAAVDWSRVDFMLLFFRDFVDGAWFHRNDTKIASQLVGNLTLENVRENRLRYTRSDRRRLRRLDIARGRGAVLGPTPWFLFITHTVAQKTARLILEYNQHCIPADELPGAHAEDRELFDRWLARREELSRWRREGRAAKASEVEIKGVGGSLVYRTTEFNALHFLEADPKRDAAIERRYGSRILELLLEDRRRLVREVFGTYPLHNLPPERRTFNPYAAYCTFVASGRVLLLPFLFVWWSARGSLLAVRRVASIVRDVLDPSERRPRVDAATADFGVARRKLHRMRRPVVMETIRLRAQLDPEYLGLSLPALEPTLGEGQPIGADLRAIDAAEREWEEFRELRADRERCLRLLDGVLRERGIDPSGLRAEIRSRYPHLAPRLGEVVRALALAFVCDCRGTRRTAEAIARLEARLAEVAARSDAHTGRANRRVRREVAERLATVRPWLRPAGVPAGEPVAGGSDAAALEERFAAALAAGPSADRDALRLLSDREGGREDPREAIVEELLAEAEHAASWTEQIVAVRTVQTLAMIDLSGYEEAIARLGEFDLRAPPRV